MKTEKMNKEQKQFLAMLTCGILERYENIDRFLKERAIPKNVSKKLIKAFDLIQEVNEICFTKKPKK